MIVLVVGTGTGVGKTRVAALLASALRARGADVEVSKPLASGCRRVRGRLVSDDARALCAAIGSKDLDGACPWKAAPPLAPALAMKRPPTLAEVVAYVERRATGRGVLIVEAAGGLYVPYAADGTVLDLCVALRARVVLVGASALGTINHTCLSVAALRARGIEPFGVVLSRTRAKRTPDEASNPEAIAALCAIEPPVVVPHATKGSVGRARAALAPLAARLAYASDA